MVAETAIQDGWVGRGRWDGLWGKTAKTGYGLMQAGCGDLAVRNCTIYAQLINYIETSFRCNTLHSHSQLGLETGSSMENPDKLRCNYCTEHVRPITELALARHQRTSSSRLPTEFYSPVIQVLGFIIFQLLEPSPANVTLGHYPQPCGCGQATY